MLPSLPTQYPVTSRRYAGPDYRTARVDGPGRMDTARSPPRGTRGSTEAVTARRSPLGGGYVAMKDRTTRTGVTTGRTRLSQPSFLSPTSPPKVLPRDICSSRTLDPIHGSSVLCYCRETHRTISLHFFTFRCVWTKTVLSRLILEGTDKVSRHRF